MIHKDVPSVVVSALQRISLGAALLCAFPTLTYARPVTRTVGPTVVIGSALSLSGPGSTRGQLVRKGYELWARRANEHGGILIGGRLYRVNLLIRDDESNPLLAAQLVGRLVNEDHVRLLLGPSGSDESFAAAAVAERKAVPMILGSSASDETFEQGYRFTFGLMPSYRQALDTAILSTLRSNPRLRRVAISTGTQRYAREVAQGVADIAAQKHLLLVGIADRPEVIIASGPLFEIAMLRRRLVTEPSHASVMICIGEFDATDLRETLGSLADRILIPIRWSLESAKRKAPAIANGSLAYDALYRRRFHLPARDAAATATEAGLVAERAMTLANSIDGEAIRRALVSLRLTTFAGRVQFNARGMNISASDMLTQINGSTAVLISSNGMVLSRVLIGLDAEPVSRRPHSARPRTLPPHTRRKKPA